MGALSTADGHLESPRDRGSYFPPRSRDEGRHGSPCQLDPTPSGP